MIFAAVPCQKPFLLIKTIENKKRIICFGISKEEKDFGDVSYYTLLKIVFSQKAKTVFIGAADL